jgi:ribose transport system substrate-binding protein
MDLSPARWRHRILGGAMVVLAAVALAACGSSSSSTPTGAEVSGSQTSSSSSEPNRAKAEAEIAKNLGVPKFDSPPAFDASKAKGKSIWDVPFSSALEFQQSIDVGVTEAAKAAELQLQYFQNQGTVNEWGQGIQQGITAQSDLILLDSAPNPAQVQPQLKSAQSAGIPVVASNVPSEKEDKTGVLAPDNFANLTALTPAPYALSAELIADYAIANTNEGEVDALVITSEETSASPIMRARIEQQFEALCQDCKLKVINIAETNYAKEVQTQVQTALTQDPDLNWVLPVFDAPVQYIIPAIRGAGRTGDVHIATFDGSPSVLKDVAEGEFVAMDVGDNLEQTGWAAIDQSLRILSGVKPIEYPGAAVGVRVWTSENIAEAGDPPVASEGYGDAYKDGYLKAWGLSK